MKNKKWIAVTIAVIAAAAWFFVKPQKSGDQSQVVKEVSPKVGRIERTISSTAAVQPQNRLEMKPPVAGRVDEILVKEGQAVKSGDVVARMSSTERAALLDAAKSKSGKETAYWEDIYKPIPLIAPIDGTVIVSTMQPGQTVTQTDPVIVLSNRLIVQAQVDETDIGRVEEGQDAVITLDAYPDIRVGGRVEHIYHESTVVNNVTIYKVDILPEEVPDVFRSGMSANVRITVEKKENVLMLPLEAVHKGRGGVSVLVSEGKNKKPSKRSVETGISDEANVEILSGVDENDRVLIVSKKYVASKGAKSGSNPFMPQRSRPRKSEGSAQK